MEREKIISHLYNALQPDANLRQQAENGIMELQTKDYSYFIENMVDIFTDSRSELQLKLISGIILKNSLHSKDQAIQKAYEEKWCALDSLKRDSLKTKIIGSFSNPDEKIHLLSGSSLGHIARIELPHKMYQDFFASMEMYLLDISKAAAVYEAIGVCCNCLIQETSFVFDDVANSIFNVCMQSLVDKRLDANIKEASLKCLMNSFEALETVFKEESSIRYFMGGIAETACVNHNLAKKSLICLNRFVYLFHALLKPKMFDIVSYINNFWNIADDDTKVQLLEFWTIVSEAGDVDVVNANLDFTLSHVFKALRKGEDYNEQSWNPHKAASACLEAINGVVREKLLHKQTVFEFIDREMLSGDKERIDVAAVALGSVVSGDSEEQLVRLVKVLINNMRDPVTEESCLWALAKICETNFYSIVEHLPFLISQTCDIIWNNYQTSTSAAWILSCIFQSLQKYKNMDKLPLHIPVDTQKQFLTYAYDQINQHFTYILQVLVKATENAKLEDSTLRVALFSALSELIRLTNDANQALLDEFIKYCIQKINECVVAVNKASANYIPIIEDVLSNYVILSEVISQERKKDSSKLLLNPYLDVLKSKPTTAIGEVYIAISHNVSDFSPYLNSLMPFISRDVTCLDEFILKSAINLIGCLANSMQTDFFQASTHLIPLLIQTLSSKEVPKKLKPSILSVFGDIALALGQYFEQYLDVSLMIFDQIVGLDRKSDEKYIDDLRHNVIVMIDCIVMTTSESQKMGEYMYRIVEGIKVLINTGNSISTSSAILNLLLDLNSLYGSNFDLNGRWIESFLYECLYSKDNTLIQEANDAFQRFKFE
ncbi:Importin subunit beta [Nosema granulosis]|uniref:Importin subunit beta n=1 Tax=Nosema granulosis TaxID=83296 RepID=A0A9P6L0E7_9MICR|nr:Importin subunit beta [Nosema granulosis]